MAVTFHTFSTAGRNLFSTDGSLSVWGEIEEKLQEWLGDVCDPQLDAGTLVTGSGYTDGTYQDVTLERVANTQTGGKNLKATVEISGGGVSSVTITTKGNGFATGDYVKVKDLAEVGGTGSGFQIQLSSANEEFGLIRGLDDRTNTATYPIMFQLGCERSASYDFGFLVRKTSLTSTTYFNDIYIYNNTNPTSENGYGTYTYQQNGSFASWYDGQADHEVYVLYCNDPGNQFFVTVDSLYEQGWAVFKAVQDPATPEKYPITSAFSPWTSMAISESSINVRPMTTSYYNTTYTGAYQTAPVYPYDAKVLFNNGIVYGRSYITGAYPDKFYTHNNTDLGWGHVYQDGADTYRRMANVFYIKTN